MNTKTKKTKAVLSSASYKVKGSTRALAQPSPVSESETETDDLRLASIYIEPIPTDSFTLKVRLQPTVPGKTKLFPSEFK